MVSPSVSMPPRWCATDIRAGIDYAMLVKPYEGDSDKSHVWSLKEIAGLGG